MRPFAYSAKVKHRGCSAPLQRVVTDFAADVSFGQAMDKLVEHYGVLLSESTIRRITQGHARRIFERQGLREDWPAEPGRAIVVVEMDGGMVPLVCGDAKHADRRKGKRLYWQEAKLCLAHEQGSTQRSYGGTLQGDVGHAGRHLFHCARMAGFGANTRVHAVGDGAEWISGQVQERFGANGRYLVDFYHVCEYLNAAAQAIMPAADTRPWFTQQKERLKSNAAAAVIDTLKAHVEPPSVADAEAPVRRCHRYLSNRIHQMHYQQALADGLPIGSGQIESAHRYIVQQRLKRPGAWWNAANAEHMLALRLNRANDQWQRYWANHSKQAA